VCKYLIEEGKASINKASNDRNTPLKWATSENQTAVVAFLKSKGGAMHEEVVEDEISVEAM